MNGCRATKVNALEVQYTSIETMRMIEWLRGTVKQPGKFYGERDVTINYGAIKRRKRELRLESTETRGQMRQHLHANYGKDIWMAQRCFFAAVSTAIAAGDIRCRLGLE